MGLDPDKLIRLINQLSMDKQQEKNCKDNIRPQQSQQQPQQQPLKQSQKQSQKQSYRLENGEMKEAMLRSPQRDKCSKQYQHIQGTARSEEKKDDGVNASPSLPTTEKRVAKTRTIYSVRKDNHFKLRTAKRKIRVVYQ